MTELTYFKASDIRGVIGRDIDKGVAYSVGRADAQHSSTRSLVIGFDVRETSPALAAAAASDNRVLWIGLR